VVLADRMGCLKGGVVANVVIPTPDYVRFATHYRFRPDFCEGHDPESKGMVEHLVGYAKRDLMGPQAPFSDLAAANLAAARWCAEVNAVTHSEIGAVPAERLATEQELLAALPGLRLEIGPRPVTRKVDRLSTIRFASARYSAPTRMVGRQVQVVPVGDQLRLLDPVTGEVLAEHALLGPGQVSIMDAHYPHPRPDKPLRAPRARTATETRFLALGEIAEAFLTGAAAAGVTKLGGEIEQINTLTAAHGEQAVTAALRRAVAFRRWRAVDIGSILAAGSGVATPRAAGEALVLDLPVAPTRSLDAYRIGGQR
jgi:hypothetical protein